MTDYKTACIFGGTGFIGTQIVRELAAHGVRIKVATRVPESAYFLRPCGSVGQVVPFPCDYSDPQSIEQAVSGCDYVVNCITNNGPHLVDGLIGRKSLELINAIYVSIETGKEVVLASNTKESKLGY